jgi:hypothetical protein
MPSEHDLTLNLLENTVHKCNILFPLIYTNSRNILAEIMQ